MITGRDPAFCSGDDVKQVMVAASDELTSCDRTPRLTAAAGVLYRTDDHREGVRSFPEKRPPTFTGR